MATLTAKKIKELVEEYNLGEIYVVIHAGYEDPDSKEKDKEKRCQDRLGAFIFYKDTKAVPNPVKIPKVLDDLFDPLDDIIIKTVSGYHIAGVCGPFNRFLTIGFEVDKWPKFKQLMKALGIEYEFDRNFKNTAKLLLSKKWQNIS